MPENSTSSAFVCPKRLVFTEKGTLDADLKELYRQSGIIHILAISGLHLSVIGMGVHKLFGKMRIPKAVSGFSPSSI